MPDQPADTGPTAGQVEPGSAAPPPASAAVEPTTPAPGTDTRELLALIDKLDRLLAGSDLDEIEVQVGSTGLLLRKPPAEAGAIDPDLLAALSSAVAGVGSRAGPGRSTAPTKDAGADDEEPRHHAVVAPLTGIYYASPSPGAAPYVREGTDINVGQVIGLIEAMKLFNEIKSDVSGRVVRLVAENGKLVKHKQPLIEVEPA